MHCIINVLHRWVPFTRGLGTDPSSIFFLNQSLSGRHSSTLTFLLVTGGAFLFANRGLRSCARFRKAGDLSRAHFNVLQTWDNFSSFRIFDNTSMSDVAVGPIPTQDFVSTTVMAKIIQVSVGLMSVRLPGQTVLLPHQDPRQYGVPDDATDRGLAENSQAWRESMMYLQRHIVLTTSIVTELQTMRAAMS